LETYLYDATSNLVSKTDRNGHAILYVYDALNRLTHKGYPDSTGVDYVYDLAGKIKQVTDPTGTYGMAYDNMGRLIGTTTQYSFLPGSPAPTFSNSYAYDAASNRTSLTLPDGSTNTYAYDVVNRMITLTDSLIGQFGFGYDTLSRRTSLNRPNGVNTSYGYDSVSQVLSVLHKAGATTIDGARYTYDNAGNRTAKTNQLNSVTEQYVYDAIYQLKQVSQGTTTTESYTYDAVGNRLSSLSVPSYNYNSSNELTSTPSTSFNYDNNGNTLSKTTSGATTQYTWDFENRLSSVILPGSGGTVTFKYDPFGRRIQKSSPSGTTNHLYDGLTAVEEVDGAGNKLARYVQGMGMDEPFAETRLGTTVFYEQDALGSVTTLTGPTGAVSSTYTYDSFGNLAMSTGSLTNPFQYTGRDYDPETGLRYYRARYYDSQGGRFINEDPIRFGGGVNFYDYVQNNPADSTDPSGARTRVCCRRLLGPGGNAFFTRLQRWIARGSGQKHCFILITGDAVPPQYNGRITIALNRNEKKKTGELFPPNDPSNYVNDESHDCKDVRDATPCKEKSLIAGYDDPSKNPCPACGSGYSWLGPNSNTFAWETVHNFGMTPPHMWWAPGYGPYYPPTPIE
jgi:RHS repeat-associated protein